MNETQVCAAAKPGEPDACQVSQSSIFIFPQNYSNIFFRHF